MRRHSHRRDHARLRRRPAHHRSASRARGELTVLAGTVRTPEEAEAAAAAGAEACVAPALVPEMVERCRTLGLPADSRRSRPSELEAARALGAELSQTSPAASWGPSYVREVLAPLRGVQLLLVTGGVDPSNTREFIDAGAVAVGVGSALTGRRRRRVGGAPARGRGCEARRVWRNVARRRGAMVVPRQGRRERPYPCDTGATEDAASGRAACPCGSAGVSSNPPKRSLRPAAPGSRRRRRRRRAPGRAGRSGRGRPSPGPR